MRWRPDATTMALAAAFVLALTLRLAWLAETDTIAPPLSDPQYYHATAQNVADGRGFAIAVDDRGFVAGEASESTAFWPPGYPFVLAGFYALLGDDQELGQWENALAGALTIVPVFFVGRALGRRTSPPGPLQPAVPPRRSLERGSLASPARGEVQGLLAAAILALMPSLIYWTSSLFSEPLFALCVATTLALALHASKSDVRRALPWALGIGFALSATALVRSQGVALIVPIAILLVPRIDLRAAALRLAPVVAACALVIVPWTIRNAVVMGEPYVINNNLCYNLRAAHAPYSTGGSVAPQDLWDEQPGITFRERELLFDEIGCGRAWDYAREHSKRELELSAKRVGWLLRSDAAPAIDWAESLGRTPLRRSDPDTWVLLGDTYWYPLLALALLSPLFVTRSRPFVAMWSLLVVWAALHAVFHGEPRYHVPMTPILASLAAATIVSTTQRIRHVRLEQRR